MCQYEHCKGGYGSAYAKSESVAIDLQLFCQKCKEPTLLKDQSFVHFGGEQWEPAIRCEKCGWTIVLKVIPRTIFLARK